MSKRHSTALFAAIMILMLLPFVPAYVQSMSASDTATQHGMTVIQHSSISAYITAGYVGAHGLSATAQHTMALADTTAGI